MLVCAYGLGDSSVVRAPDSRSKGLVSKSLQEWTENYLLQGQSSVQALLISVSYLLQGQPSVLTLLISVSVPPPSYRSST